MAHIEGSGDYTLAIAWDEVELGSDILDKLVVGELPLKDGNGADIERTLFLIRIEKRCVL
jgi:hypothetical protein